MKMRDVGDDYDEVLDACGIDPNGDGSEDEPLVPYEVSDWCMLTRGGDFAVDVIRSFESIGREAPVARLIAERGLLSEVVLALGGSVDASYPLGALVFRASEFLLDRTWWVCITAQRPELFGWYGIISRLCAIACCELLVR